MKIIMLLSFLFLSACSIVGAGERGVRLNFGKPADKELTPGIYLWIPVVAGLTKVDTQIQKSEVTTPSASKDMQEIMTVVAINWSIEADKVVNLYKTVGKKREVLDRLIAPAVNEVLKSTSAKLTAEEILSKRIEMKTDIDNSLKGRLDHYGVRIHDINIVDLKFSSKFTHAVESKQIAEQKAKKAYHEAIQMQLKADGQAKANVTMAKAKAEQTVLEAKADAEAKLLRATSEAKANKTVSESLTKELIEYEKIKNWDGKLPKVTGTSGTLISINGDK